MLSPMNIIVNTVVVFHFRVYEGGLSTSWTPNKYHHLQRSILKEIIIIDNCLNESRLWGIWRVPTFWFFLYRMLIRSNLAKRLFEVKLQLCRWTLICLSQEKGFWSIELKTYISSKSFVVFREVIRSPSCISTIEAILLVERQVSVQHFLKVIPHERTWLSARIISISCCSQESHW